MDDSLPTPTARPVTPPRVRGDDLLAALRAAGADPRVASSDGPVAGSAETALAALEVTGLTLSSSRVLPGDLYAALPGARRHGAEFAADAVAAGAIAVLTDDRGAALVAEAARGGTERPAVPVIVVGDPRSVLGALAAAVHDHPARALATVAVTGTQGKTTTTRLLEATALAAGVRAGVVGTLGTRVAGHEVRTALTTPEAPDLHALLSVMREQRVALCAMEVSSHALVLGRVDGVVFDVAVFTNLGRDHLDFHADVEEYFAAKASLFTPDRARRALINVDDEHGRRLVGMARAAGLPVTTFALDDPEADWVAEVVEARAESSSFTVRTPDGRRLSSEVALPGRFNVANALAALAAAAEAGLDVAALAGAMAAGGGVPGRLERIEQGQDFTVVVDYAHKPDAVVAALQTLRPLTSGRLILVLGAGGDRDPGKRGPMGEIGARLADVLVVTDDNPRSERPASIRAALLAGAAEVPAAERAELVEQGDRRAAIRHAVGLARTGDIVLIAGKGHETGQEVEGVVTPFDDRVVASDELVALAGRDADEGAPR